jgi:hypothetical protein
VGLEGGMIVVVPKHACTLLAAALTAALVLPHAATATPSRDKHVRAKITVYPKQRWRGYGFLPGYRPQAAEALGVPLYGRQLPRREIRYWDWYGNVRYGWGYPGYYRGRWNGGGFGPCWTSTPIGMMPTCGQ